MHRCRLAKGKPGLAQTTAWIAISYLRSAALMAILLGHPLASSCAACAAERLTWPSPEGPSPSPGMQNATKMTEIYNTHLGTPSKGWCQVLKK